MKRSAGFTVIELVIVIVVLSVASIFLLSQRADLAATHRDDQRKTAINAIYYNLEEVYYEAHGSYPSTLTDRAQLSAMDPALFTDPFGVELGQQQSNYRYEASNCVNERCEQYKLRSSMEREADYVKQNRAHDDTK